LECQREGGRGVAKLALTKVVFLERGKKKREGRAKRRKTGEEGEVLEDLRRSKLVKTPGVKRRN